MAGVFLSYAQEDRARARQVADALRECGWDVWWDAHVQVGSRFRAEIRHQLQSAKCVVVLWSQASIDSDWVTDEADDGKNRGILVQALIDATQPPHGFRGIQWADLTSWSGDLQAEEFVKLVEGISRYAPNKDTAQTRGDQSPTRQQLKIRAANAPELTQPGVADEAVKKDNDRTSDHPHSTSGEGPIPPFGILCCTVGIILGWFYRDYLFTVVTDVATRLAVPALITAIGYVPAWVVGAFIGYVGGAGIYGFVAGILGEITTTEDR